MAKYKDKETLLKEIAETNRKVMQGELKPREGKRLIEMARRRLNNMGV